MKNQSREFETVQRCRQPFIWIVVFGIAIFIWYSAYQQILLGNPVGNNPAPDVLLIVIWLVIGIGFPLAL